MTYLDYNASAPLLPDARAAMLAALDIDGNPSSVHASGRKLRAAVQKARRQVAALVGTRPDHIVFTSGATEAAMLLLTPGWSMGRAPLAMGHLYVAASDHPCLLGGGRFPSDRVTHLPVDCGGVLDMVALERALADHDADAGLPLVALHWANNETGVIQSIRDIGAIVARAGGVFILDAVQALGRIPVSLSEGCADFLILSSHKIGGPKGAGAIAAKSDLMMPLPLIRGGGQERGHRGGTESAAAIAGFGAAAWWAGEHIGGMAALAPLRDRFEARLRDLAPGATIHGVGAPRLPNTSFFTLPGARAETVAIGLDLAGFAVSSGSACSSGKVGRSHVLTAMGVAGEEGAVRVSFGHGTTPDDLDALLDALGALILRMRAA